MLAIVLLGTLILSSPQLLAFPLTPDPSETPGELCDTRNHDFQGYRFLENVPICRRDVSRELKQRIYERYKIPKSCRSEYTIDHFYPLSMGGSNSQKNLWPEHEKIKKSRFDLEQETFEQMVDGKLSQQQAFTIIRNHKLNPNVPDTNDSCLIKHWHEADSPEL